MRTFVVALIVALLVSAVSVEIYSRLLEGSYVGMLVLVALACLVTTLAAPPIAARLATDRSQASAPPANRAPEPDVTGKRESGTVKWFNRTKGFGFIVRENGEEIFVHHRSIRSDGQRRSSLRDGQRVSFEVVERSKGLQAEDVAVS